MSNISLKEQYYYLAKKLNRLYHKQAVQNNQISQMEEKLAKLNEMIEFANNLKLPSESDSKMLD